MSAKHLNPQPTEAKPESAGIPNRPFPLKSIIGSLVLIAVAIAAAAVLLPKSAKAKDIIGLSDAEKKQVQQIETYLNAVKTMSSRFMQVTDTGHFAQGEFYMARPGRMRIDYDDPVPILIVSNGAWVMYKDEELDQISHLPLSQVPASMFIGGTVDFFGDDLMITHFENEAGVQRLTLQRSEDPSEGALTLVFEASPIQLKKWSVMDAQGTTTTVSLLGPTFGKKLDDSLFVVENPTMQRKDN
jgi:outer membrane lipoprotein-sorting protein